MTEFGKIVVASSLSVLAHVTLFTVLALMPEPALVPAEPQPKADLPLEVTIQPAPLQDAQDEPSPVPLNAVLPEPSETGGIRTQLDPENLKKAEKAPEHPTAIAAHDSQATPGKTAAPATPSPSPESEPQPELALALQPVPASATKEDTEEAPGIDALGSYQKAVGNAIGLRWEDYRKNKKYFLAVGVVRLKVAIDAQGHVADVRVLANSAASSNAACAVQAVKEAKIPPIPPERLAQLAGDRIEIEYTFISTP